MQIMRPIGMCIFWQLCVESHYLVPGGSFHSLIKLYRVVAP
jgi:hypothetical protein